MTVAAASDVFSSSGILSILLGGGLLTAVIGAYRFVVNLRTTERGLARSRLRDANSEARRAEYESSLWQSRCGDLEYLLRQNGVTVPPYSKEVQRLVDSPDSAGPDLTKFDGGPKGGAKT